MLEIRKNRFYFVTVGHTLLPQHKKYNSNLESSAIFLRRRDKGSFVVFVSCTLLPRYENYYFYFDF